MQQRRVLITGAGSGLGRALAFVFAENGWRVACADINIDAANETVRRLTEFGVGAMPLWVDVADDRSVEEMRDEVLAAWDGVDTVISNAGVASAGSVAETSLEDWLWTLNINLLGVVRCCRAFLPAMLRQARGHFINVASFAGIVNAPHMGAYSASKAGVISFSETLRAELALKASGMKVSVVCPSFFQTNLMQTSRAPETDRALASKLMAAAKESADDVAAAVYRSAMRGDFMIFPTRTEPMRWRVKRYAPELFLRKLLGAYRTGKT